MTALDKFLALSGTAELVQPEDAAGHLVLAAASGLRELVLLLAGGDEDGDDDTAENDSGQDHSGHDTYKAAKKRGLSDAACKAACMAADKKIKACALADSALVALSGLACPEENWVELTACDHRSVVALAGGGKMPYGDVEYADPGYQKDGKKRYPVDTEEHTRAAWSYINQEKNAGEYSPEDAASIKAKIKLAMKKHGIQAGDDTKANKTIAASMVLALAAGRSVEAMVAMHHGSFSGRHQHPHVHNTVVSEEHFHNNDSDHSRHWGVDVGSRDW